MMLNHRKFDFHSLGIGSRIALVLLALLTLVTVSEIVR